MGYAHIGYWLGELCSRYKGSLGDWLPLYEGALFFYTKILSILFAYVKILSYICIVNIN